MRKIALTTSQKVEKANSYLVPWSRGQLAMAQISQKELADFIGMSASALSQMWIRGNTTTAITIGVMTLCKTPAVEIKRVMTIGEQL